MNRRVWSPSLFCDSHWNLCHLSAKWWYYMTFLCACWSNHISSGVRRSVKKWWNLNKYFVTMLIPFPSSCTALWCRPAIVALSCFWRLDLNKASSPSWFRCFQAGPDLWEFLRSLSPFFRTPDRIVKSQVQFCVKVLLLSTNFCALFSVRDTSLVKAILKDPLHYGKKCRKTPRKRGKQEKERKEIWKEKKVKERKKERKKRKQKARKIRINKKNKIENRKKERKRKERKRKREGIKRMMNEWKERKK